MKSLKQVAQLVTGGRPMKLIRDNVVKDPFGKKDAGLYLDQCGRRWLSQSRWGVLRVAVPDEVKFNS